MRFRPSILLLLALPLLGLAQAPEPDLPTGSTGPAEGASKPGESQMSSTELLDSGTFMPNPQAGAPKAGQAPKHTTIAVEFVGGRVFSENEMRGAIADSLKDMDAQGLNNALADDAAFFLANHYREHGYAQVEVNFEIRGSNRLILKIKEGPQFRIGRVLVSGNRQVTQTTALDYLLGPTHERFPKEHEHPPFVEGDLESGVDWLRSYLQAQGFLNSSIQDPVFDYRQGLVDVSVQTSEGTKYTFGTVTFTGEIVFSQQELLKTFGDLSSKPYTTQEVLHMQQQLEYFYKTKGYFEASVQSHGAPEAAVNGRVPVDFTVEPGDLFTFDDITVTGLQKLKPSFLPNRFRRLKGKTYNPEQVQKITREMTRTGLFKSFRTREEAQADKTVRLNINVEEAKAKELGFLLGYSTLEGATVGASYRDRNLFGMGRPLTTTAQYSTKGLRGEIAYSDPWFMSDWLILRLRLYALTRQYDGYSKLEGGLRTEVAHKLTEDLEVSTFIQGRQVNLQDILIEPDVDLSHYHGKERARRREQAREDLIGPTSYLINSLGFGISYDTRDSKINPTKGVYLNSTLDSAVNAFGSQINFLRGTIAGSYYHSFGGKKGMIALGARAGIIDPFKERGSIPIDERFFNGGSLTVRSFAERQLGPKDRNGFPVGGDTFTVFNAEYDFPLYGELEGATFVDAGSLGTGNDFGEMRYGVGVGLRYRLPIGPLRLDYAVNPTRKRDEAIGAFHFSFGFAF